MFCTVSERPPWFIHVPSRLCVHVCARLCVLCDVFVGWVSMSVLLVESVCVQSSCECDCGVCMCVYVVGLCLAAVRSRLSLLGDV